MAKKRYSIFDRPASYGVGYAGISEADIRKNKRKPAKTERTGSSPVRYGNVVSTGKSRQFVPKKRKVISSKVYWNKVDNGDGTFTWERKMNIKKERFGTKVADWSPEAVQKELGL